MLIGKKKEIYKIKTEFLFRHEKKNQLFKNWKNHRNAYFFSSVLFTRARIRILSR